MFLRKRVVPPTPPSLVKFASRAASLSRGCFNSTPISDQVPELMYAHEEDEDAGTAAMADAVSCDAGAITGAALIPVSATTEGRSGPRTVPGWTSVPRISAGMPNAWIK